MSSVIFFEGLNISHPIATNFLSYQISYWDDLNDGNFMSIGLILIELFRLGGLVIF